MSLLPTFVSNLSCTIDIFRILILKLLIRGYNDFLHLISLWFVRMMEVWFIEARKSRMIYSWMLRYIIMHCPNFLRIVNLSNDRHLMQVIHFDKSIAYLCITPAIVFAFSYFCKLWVFCKLCKLTCLLSWKELLVCRDDWK